MQGIFNMTLLSVGEHVNNATKLKFYKVSFLDETDKSYSLFINENQYDDISKLKRFDEVIVTLSIYTDRNNHYQFNVISVEKLPFNEKSGE